VLFRSGSILAVVVLYWRTFWEVALGLLRLQPQAIRFIGNLLIAFLPSVALGLIFKDRIDMLLASPLVVAWAMIAGGGAILVVERYARPGDYQTLGELPVRQVLGVGLLQCLAMIPGVSRSGATIMGALMMGIDRRTAAEFSFFLAIPTMLGASALELWDNRAELAAGTGVIGWSHIAVGFVVSFVVALAVIRLFVGYVSRSGFAPFAWYRIGAGLLALAIFSQ